MKFAVTAEEMKKIDQNTTILSGIPSLVLMEQAAESMKRLILKRAGMARDTEQIRNACDTENAENTESIQNTHLSVCIVCGMGNNGGDGLALSRLLMESGMKTDVILVGNREKTTEQWKEQYKHLLRENEYHIQREEDFECLKNAGNYDIIVDAIFGIGLTREITGVFKNMIAWINEKKEKGAFVYSADLPSGIHTDTGIVMGEAVQADVTVTFGFLKRGLIFYPGCLYAGEIFIENVGFTKEALEITAPECYYLEKDDLRQFPKRRPDGHKGTFGKLLLVAGEEGMAGAACFASLSAYRMGCGLVSLLTHESNRLIAQELVPEALYHSWKEFADGNEKQILERVTAICIGPGLGKGKQAQDILRYLLETQCVPMVMDADALNLLAEKDELRSLAINYRGDLILTPHIGELSRLLSEPVNEIKSDLFKAAERAASKYHAVCVAKDARTVIVSENGEKRISRTGSQAMAKGGSGDILAGMIGSLLAQGRKKEEAASYGVYLHGMAGEKAGEKLGSGFVMARDIIQSLSDVWKEIEKAW